MEFWTTESTTTGAFDFSDMLGELTVGDDTASYTGACSLPELGDLGLDTGGDCFAVPAESLWAAFGDAPGSSSPVKAEPLSAKRPGLWELFPKEALRSDPTVFAAHKDRVMKAHSLSRSELQQVMATRKRERACVHAAISRNKRINSTSSTLSQNISLRDQNDQLRRENVALERQLAAARRHGGSGLQQYH